MKLFKFLITGVLFGIIMSKSEAISWYRIQEMFRLQAFHMYGIIGTAVVLGATGIAIIKKFKLKDINGTPIKFHPKEKAFTRYIIGGTIFGFGWVLIGACPGPLFVNLGYGYVSIIVAILFATLGTYIYGVLAEKLPR